MNCERCNRDNCVALFEHFRDDGSASPDWFATARAFEDCAEAAAKRALRAEAEVRALCGEPEALDSWLPEGWAWQPSCDEWHGPHDLYVTCGGCLGRGKRGVFCPERRSYGLLSVMVDAVADVEAVEQALRSKP